ncbi:MAG: hypothetical protein JWN70_5136 [Planctomycetaceae bacterium]|nr:hypothetical protein [Planctomycetaceae bacterium]
MTEQQRKPTPWLWWTLAGLMLLVAYPLSMGPVAWVFEICDVENGEWASELATVFYRPIGRLVAWSPACESIYIQYLSLWVKDL